MKEYDQTIVYEKIKQKYETEVQRLIFKPPLLLLFFLKEKEGKEIQSFKLS